jgi:hypothetical protein
VAVAEGRYIGQFRPEFSRLYEDKDLYWISPFAAPVVLGVAGKRLVGVGTVTDYLCTRYGFRSYSLGIELRLIAEERGVPIEHRRYLQDLGDEIRSEKKDPAFLARRVLRRMRADHLQHSAGNLQRGIVVSGLKTTEELKVFEALRSFKPMEVRMEDDDLRFRRAKRGVLTEEYEADRKRQMQRERDPEIIAPWTELSEAQQQAYFERLDRIHVDGHPGSLPPQYKGAPAKVVTALRNPLVILNDFHSLADLHRELDEKQPEFRTARQIVHH